MRASYFTADVFTDRAFGGNQLAVFPDASTISPGLFQSIAREFNYSETTFVLPPDNPAHTKRVRIFTPGGELPFAGHPTVGTAHVLAAIGVIPLTSARTPIVFEEGVGPVSVTIHAEEGRPTFAQLAAAKLPELGPPPPDRKTLAAMLSLTPDDLLEGDWGAQAVSCGVPFLFIPLRDRAAVARATLRLDAWAETLGGYLTNKVFPFSLDDATSTQGSEARRVRGRMFAPGIGVPEDPATGSAVAALGGYLGARDTRSGTLRRWTVEQGFEMGRPSILELEVDVADRRVTASRVGGKTVMVCEGSMELPPT